LSAASSKEDRMRRTSAALVALVAAIALTALAAPAWAAKAKPKTRALVVSPTDVRAGQMVTVSGGSCRSAGVLALSIDNQEFHRGYTRRGNFRYDVKLPRGLESGSHSMGASCRGSKHKAARFNIKDKKRDWDDDGCEEGYEDKESEEGHEGYGNNVRDDESDGYEEDCDEDEGKHRRKASFDVSPDVVTAGDKVWAEGTGCKKYSLVIIKLDGWPIKWTYADRWGPSTRAFAFPAISGRAATCSAPSAAAATSAPTVSRSKGRTSRTTTACTPGAASCRPARS
jgi:hypothetical protein